MGGGTLRGGGGIVEGNEGSAAAASGGEVAPPGAVLDVWPEELVSAVTQGGLPWATPGGQTAQGWGGRGWGVDGGCEESEGRGGSIWRLSRDPTRARNKVQQTRARGLRPRPGNPARPGAGAHGRALVPSVPPILTFDTRIDVQYTLQTPPACARPTFPSRRVGMESARVRPRWSESGTC